MINQIKKKAKICLEIIKQNKKNFVGSCLRLGLISDSNSAWLIKIYFENENMLFFYLRFFSAKLKIGLNILIFVIIVYTNVFKLYISLTTCFFNIHHKWI